MPFVKVYNILGEPYESYIVPEFYTMTYKPGSWNDPDYNFYQAVPCKSYY